MKRQIKPQTSIIINQQRRLLNKASHETTEETLARTSPNNKYIIGKQIHKYNKTFAKSTFPLNNPIKEETIIIKYNMVTLRFALQRKYFLKRKGNIGAIRIITALNGVKNKILIALEYIFDFCIFFQFITCRLSPCERAQTTMRKGTFCRVIWYVLQHWFFCNGKPLKSYGLKQKLFQGRFIYTLLTK